MKSITSLKNLRAPALVGAVAVVGSLLTMPASATDPKPAGTLSAKSAAVRVFGSRTVRAGELTSIDVQARKGARCRMSLSDGSRIWRSRAIKAGSRATVLQFPWKQPSRASSKRWTMKVSCTKNGDTRARTRSLRVKKTKAGKHVPPRFLKPQRVIAATPNPIDGLGGGPGSAPKGTLLVAGSSWLGGAGVDVRSNGKSSDSSESDRWQYGLRWQCVELVNRLIMTRGWSGKIWGNAYQFFGNASSANFDKHPAGDGYVPRPGDIMVWRAGYKNLGHVAVVRDISGGMINFLEQNSSVTGQNARALQGDGAPGDYGHGYRFVGYLHAKANNPATPPPPAPPVQPVLPKPTTPPPPPTSATITGNPCSTAERAPNCVPARVAAAPNNSAAKLGTFSYGQRLTVRCWAGGQLITDGNNSDPSDDARTFTSDLWYGIDWNGGRGYVAATWTTKNNNRFGLPGC